MDSVTNHLKMADRQRIYGAERRRKALNCHIDTSSWRAGCVARCMTGSEGGSGKRAGRKAKTAPPTRPCIDREGGMLELEAAQRQLDEQAISVGGAEAPSICALAKRSSSTCHCE